MRILNDDVRWKYSENGRRDRKYNDICQSFCVFTKSGMHLIGGWENGDDERSSLTSKKAEHLLRVYSSPNCARRLSDG